MRIKNAFINEQTIGSLGQLLSTEINSNHVMSVTRMAKSFDLLFREKMIAQREITDRYTEKDKTGVPVVAVDEQGNEIPNAVRITDTEKFNEDMGQLFNTDVELDWEPVKFEELGIEKIRPDQFIMLEFLFI